MKNEVLKFEFNNLQIRTICNELGQVFFVAKDVCDVLGYANTNDAILRHCKSDGVVKHEVMDNLGRLQNSAIITEGNLYRLVLKSKKKESETFESWVCDEVLPSIRKTGKYEKKPASTLDILEMTIKNLREQNLQLDEVKSDLKTLKSTVDEIKVFNAPIEHFSIMGYCRNVKKQIGISEAKVFGTKARALCNQLGYVIGKIPDPRFGTVNTYPLDVLREVISN